MIRRGDLYRVQDPFLGVGSQPVLFVLEKQRGKIAQITCSKKMF